MPPIESPLQLPPQSRPVKEPDLPPHPFQPLTAIHVETAENRALSRTSHRASSSSLDQPASAWYNKVKKQVKRKLLPSTTHSQPLPSPPDPHPQQIISRTPRVFGTRLRTASATPSASYKPPASASESSFSCRPLWIWKSE